MTDEYQCSFDQNSVTLKYYRKDGKLGDEWILLENCRMIEHHSYFPLFNCDWYKHSSLCSVTFNEVYSYMVDGKQHTWTRRILMTMNDVQVKDKRSDSSIIKYFTR